MQKGTAVVLPSRVTMPATGDGAKPPPAISDERLVSP
jgi:hypothetical protein